MMVMVMIVVRVVSIVVSFNGMSFFPVLSVKRRERGSVSPSVSQKEQFEGGNHLTIQLMVNDHKKLSRKCTFSYNHG